MPCVEGDHPQGNLLYPSKKQALCPLFMGEELGVGEALGVLFPPVFTCMNMLYGVCAHVCSHVRVLIGDVLFHILVGGQHLYHLTGSFPIPWSAA